MPQFQDDIDDFMSKRKTTAPKPTQPAGDDIDSFMSKRTTPAPTPFTGGRKVSPQDAAKYPTPVSVPSLASNPSAKQSPVGYIGEPSVNDPNSPVGIQKEPWWGTDTDASGKETGAGMSINKPVGVAPKPRVVDPRARQAAQITRKINEQRNEATRLFQQADKTPGFAVGGGLNPGQQLRAQAEGKLEQANMLAKSAQQSHGDLLEVGFGKDIDPNSKRQWAYAKPKTLKAKEEADAMAIRARDVERPADPRIQRQVLDLRTPMQKAASPGPKFQPVDTSNDPNVNWVQDKIARFGRAAVGTIPGAISGTAKMADAIYGGVNRLTGNRLPTEGISSDWSPVVSPPMESLQKGIEDSLPVDPARNEDFSSKIASGFGSAAGFGKIGGAARALGLPFKAAIGASGVGLGADEIANEMKQAGFDRNVDPARYDRAVLLGGATGLSELVGLGKTLERFGLKRAAIQRGLEVLENSGQEAFQQWMGNVNAAKVGAYDKNRAQSQGVLESAILGGIISGGVQAADVGAQRMQPASIPDQIAQRTLANQVNAVRSESAPMQGIRPTTAGPTNIIPITRTAAAAPSATTTPAIEPTISTPVKPEPSANLPVAAESQSSAFPRLPARQMTEEDALLQFLGGKEPVENRINRIIEGSERLLRSSRESDQKRAGEVLKRALAQIQTSEGYQAELGLPDDAPKPYTAVVDAIEARLSKKPGESQKAEGQVSLNVSKKGKEDARLAAIEIEQKAAAQAAKSLESGRFLDAKNALTRQKDALLSQRGLIDRNTPQGQQEYSRLGDQIQGIQRQQTAITEQSRQAAKQANAPTAGLAKRNENEQPLSGDKYIQNQQLNQKRIENETAPLKERAGVKAMLTRDDMQQLADLGYSRLERNAMTPDEGAKIIAEGRRKDIEPAPLLRPEAVQNPEGGIPQMPEQTFSGRLDQGIRKQDAQKPSAPAKRLISRIQELGGISSRYGGELQGVKDAQRIGVVRNKAEMSPDILARQLQSEGYDVDPENLDTLWRAIDRDISTKNERPANTADLNQRLKDEEADYYARQEEAANEPTRSFDQIDEEVQAEFKPDTADLRQVREFGRREDEDPGYTEEPPEQRETGRRITPFRPPAPARPQGVGNRPMSIDVAGTRTPSAMSAEFPRARRAMVQAGREVESRLKAGQEKGEFGNFANAMFKSNEPGVLHGQDSFFHDPDLKGKLGLTRDAEMADVRKELKTQLARSLGVTVDEVSLSHIKPEVWRAWARQKGLGDVAMRKLEAGIARAEGKENAIKTNAQIVAEESQRGKSEVREPEGKAAENAPIKTGKVNVPELAPHEGGWVAIRRSDGEAVREFDRGSTAVNKIDFEKYKLVSIGEYLSSLNKKLRETPDVEAARQKQAMEPPSSKASEPAPIKTGDSVTWKRGDITESGTVTKIAAGYATYEKPDGTMRTVPVAQVTAAPKIRERKTSGFFSQLERTIEQKMPAKASAAQVRAIIENPQSGVKPDEIKWTGLDDYLRGKETVTKAEVQEFLKANQVEVQEVESDKKAYAQYTLPGAKEGSYKELLLTLPESGDPATIQRTKDRLKEIDLEIQGLQFAGIEDADQQIEELEAEERQLKSSMPTYRSSHFDEPNILAHLRFNERADSEGKRVMHVEEIQSDWHQEGRKKGYSRPPLTTAQRAELLQLGNRRNAEQEAAHQAEQSRIQGKTVPDAPFKKNWHELAFKRALRYAAENGYDKMTWTTGEQQADRFDLSKQVDRIEWQRNADGSYNISPIKDGRGVPGAIKENVSLSSIEELVGKDIATKIERGEGQTWQGAGKTQGTLSGLDLKVGGEGMKGFYDSILPAFANKYGRKWGVKVGEAKVETGSSDAAVEYFEFPDGVNVYNSDGDVVAAVSTTEEAERLIEKGRTVSATVHSIDITPAMRESVMQGQPLFRKDSVTPFTGRYTVKDLAENATAEYRPARNRPGTVYLNDWGHALLADTIVQVYGEKYSGVSGDLTISANTARNLADKIRERANGELVPIAKTLETAADDADANGRDVAIVTHRPGQAISRTKTNVRHETTHAAQSAIDEAVTGAATDLWLDRQPKAKQIREALTARGYTPDTHGYEAVAFTASGEFDALGLSFNEAEGLLDSYYRATVRKYGASALEKFGAINPKLQPTLERAKDEAGIRRPTTERTAENTGRSNRDATIRARQEEQSNRGGNESATQGRQGRAAEVPAVSRKTREDVENSPAFKRWFGDSKVVDENGRPLVVYHGTSAPVQIETFDKRLSNPQNLYGDAPGYFTDNPEVAGGEEGYAQSKSPYRQDASSPSVYPVYLRIKNPFNMDDTVDDWNAVISRMEELRPDVDFNDAVEKLDQLDRWENIDNDSIFQSIANLAMREDGSSLGRSEARDLIENLGYDGIVHTGGNRKGQGRIIHKVYIPFRSTQIKSATGNRGTFDPASPKITERKEKRASFGETDREDLGRKILRVGDVAHDVAFGEEGNIYYSRLRPVESNIGNNLKASVLAVGNGRFIRTEEPLTPSQMKTYEVEPVSPSAVESALDDFASTYEDAPGGAFQRPGKREYATIHPSTKERGQYQATFYSDKGIISDTQHDSITDAVKELARDGYVKELPPSAADKLLMKSIEAESSRKIRASFGELENEPKGEVLGAFPGNIQNWLGKSKPKQPAAPTKPEPVPADWDQKKWTKKAIDALVTRDMPKEDREKFYNFGTKKAERLALVQKYMPSKADINAMLAANQRALNAIKNNDGDDLREAIWEARAIAERPANNYEKTSAVMRASMFGQIPGRLRDIISNSAMQKLETAARIPGSAADMFFTGLRRGLGGSGERSYLGPRPVDFFKNRSADRARQWKQAKDVMKGKHVDALEDILQHREVNFDNRFLDKTTKTVFRAMGALDQWFFVKEYQRAIREQAELAARAEVRSGVIQKADRQKQADAYAAAPTTEMKVLAETAAKQIVFRNPNLVSNVMQAVREKLPPGGNFALDLIMPVDKTPTNIILAALEYSPLGAVKLAGQMTGRTAKATVGAIRNRKAMPTREAVKKALDDAFPLEKQRAMSRLFGRTVVGSSGPVLLGYALAAAGMATGFYDEDDPGEEAKRREEGKMPNSVRIGDRWYELSGIAPLGSLIGLGATLHRETNATTLDPEKRYKRLMKGFGDMVLDLPSLESAKQTVKIGKDLTGTPSDLGRVTGNIGARFIPGILGNIGQAIPGVRDPFEREVKSPKSGEKDIGSLAAKAGREFVGEFATKIPGARRLLPEKMNSLTGKPFETEWSDVFDPFRSRPAVEPGQLGDVKKATRKFDISTEVKPKPGEPDAVYEQRKGRVEGWMDYYGGMLLNDPRYQSLSPDMQEAAIENLRKRIGRQQNIAQPKIDRRTGQIESFTPGKVLEGVNKSVRERPKRQAKNLWNAP